MKKIMIVVLSVIGLGLALQSQAMPRTVGASSCTVSGSIYAGGGSITCWIPSDGAFQVSNSTNAYIDFIVPSGLNTLQVTSKVCRQHYMLNNPPVCSSPAINYFAPGNVDLNAGSFASLGGATLYDYYYIQIAWPATGKMVNMPVIGGASVD